jgi:hypothetical protein
VNLRKPAIAVGAHPSGISLSSSNLIRITGCARPGCNQKGVNACSACLREFYCSADCQKKDWKTHKIFCCSIKLKPETLQSFTDASPVVSQVLNQTEAQVAKLGSQRYIKLLHHTATFSEKQFGKRIAGRASYERDNEDSIDD